MSISKWSKLRTMDVDHLIKRIRLLTFVLIFSGGLNIALLATLVALLWEGRKCSFEGPPPSCVEEQVITNQKIAELYRGASFHELITSLTDKELVEEGYRKRDFALGALVSFHFFNLEKALGGMPLQKRVISQMNFALFPGLSDDQFLAIVRFAHQERWPFTPQKLFALLKEGAQDATLLQAFVLTTPIQCIRRVFSAAPVETLIQWLCKGEWADVERMMQDFSGSREYSEERKIELFRRYPVDALLLELDYEYALKKLDDESVLALLKTASPSQRVYSYCLALLHSMRSDAVLEESAKKLYEMVGEEGMCPLDCAVARRRFPLLVDEAVPSIRTSEGSREQEKEKVRIHTVKEGENLWKIARCYHVTVEDLMVLNSLGAGSVLRPGKELKVPDRTHPDGRGGNAIDAVR